MNLSRREWLTGLGGAAGAAMAQPPLPAYTNYFGDLHNHNVVGYAQGSLERSYRIARSQVKLKSFTALRQQMGRYFDEGDCAEGEGRCVDEYHRTSFTIRDYGEGKPVDWYYVRAVQANGRLAWSSPICVDMP